MSLDFLDIAVKQTSDTLDSSYRSIHDIIDTEARAYALYTIEQRAIPNMIDGFKPVHRFIIQRALSMARGNKDKFHKLASIAGGVADLGYHHGEGNAQEAGALMANTWNNNYPLLDGQGNFGSRLVQEAGASRYIFARISENFNKMYKDSEYAPEHEDEEHFPPKFYLPIIPTVLLNGTSGIATAYATDILPHSVESVKECTIKALKGELSEEPKIQYPDFKGNIVCTEPGKYELHGTYEWKSRKTLIITEVPYKYDREAYIKILDNLEDKGFITYDDDCSKHGFRFVVTLRKDYILGEDETERHNKIMKDFGLIERVSQNLTVIDDKGKLKEYSKASDLIKDFVELRKLFIDIRIKSKIVETEEAFSLALAKAKFIKEVINGTIVLQKKTKAQLLKEISAFDESWAPYADKLVSMNIYHITSDEAKKLAEAAKNLKSDLEYWKKTTPEFEYLKDLEAL